jgi:phage-related tail fiber protein
LDVKDSVRAATTANITLSGTQTIDGVSVTTGDRVLVKNQSTASQNGIYVVAAGSWARATDADSDAEVTPGLFTFVEEGTVNSDSGWVLSTNSTITLGTTALTFAQFSGAGQITAGDGLTKDGNTLNVATADTGRIVVNADSIDLASGVVTVGTYKSVTVDTYGRVTAGTNPTTLSGYGITDALSTSSDIDGGSYP